MRFAKVFTITILGLLCLSGANGEWAFFETKQVPIERVLKNLRLRLEKNTNDFGATYCLARVHSMAYATNLVEVKVQTKDNEPVFNSPWEVDVPQSVQRFSTVDAQRKAIEHLTNAIVLYERAIFLLRRSTNVNERKWMVLPTQLGWAWCLEQA